MLGSFTGQVVSASTRGEYVEVLLLQRPEKGSAVVVECYYKAADLAGELPTEGRDCTVSGRVVTSTWQGQTRARVAVHSFTDQAAPLAAVGL